MKKSEPVYEPLYPCITFTVTEDNPDLGYYIWMHEGAKPYGPYMTEDAAIEAATTFKELDL